MNRPLTFEARGARVELHPDGDQVAIQRRDSGELAGIANIEDQGSMLLVRSICIEQAQRGYGLGSEAARLIREHAEAGRWRYLRACAPPSIGLAVYFWSRMGLHPLPGEGPDRGLLFERALKPGRRRARPSP